MALTKTCNRCKEEKPECEFYTNRSGLHSKCKLCYGLCNKEYQAKYRANNRFAIRMRTCRERSKEKDLSFSIDTTYLEDIWTGTCPVFQTPLNIDAERGAEGHAQLDRIVPALGYVEGNVVWLSQRANRIKDDATIEDLERVLKWLKSL